MVQLRKMVYGNQGINHQLYKLYNERDIGNVIKVGQLRWLGHLPRVQEQKILYINRKELGE
jgi:hypothetical protein